MQSTTTEQATKLRKKLEIANSILQNLAKYVYFTFFRGLRLMDLLIVDMSVVHA